MPDFLPALKGAPQEEESTLRPRFDADGLITAVACSAKTGEVLMLAHMNAEALKLTLQTSKAHYWSRSRQTIWLKGETSGKTQNVKEIRVDCDQDAVVMMVDVTGGESACHTGRVSCFYRKIAVSPSGEVTLEFDEREREFDPAQVYQKNQTGI